MLAYTGKNVVIIGGTHGIGLATAKLLLSQGARVLLTGRRPDPIAEARAELGITTTTTAGAAVVQFDITSAPASLSDLQASIETHIGTGRAIDFLFINVGYALLQPTAAVSEDSFDRTFNTNMRGPFFLTQKLAPSIKPGGSILFTTSTSIATGIPGMAVYSASKAAIYSFAQTLAAELAAHAKQEGEEAVRVNAISPGFVDTPTMGTVGISREEKEAFVQIGVKTTPVGRIASAEEVAKAAVFMGIEATYSTGAELVVDGGLRPLKEGE
ncbi:hypothetical protein AJ78_03610 [Emergomyces pasteurianus Ep9510]|uniref:Ketoreductase domain-containing protein n=1 Tax=Emergomyces pasteurianus Ep9510 TaxID=1447872 RepID=A0A1J9PJU9_9EURO|nr:hypothetical protein AJ78_03610 [Emergomyces pasteurianus Ep9510]